MKTKTTVIVTGLPRSGTSLMMQMLQAGGLTLLTDGRRPPDESNPRGYFEWAPVKSIRSNNSPLREAKGKVVKIVIPLIKWIPSEITYRVVFMRRGIAQVAASQKVMLRRLAKAGGNLPNQKMEQILQKQVDEAAQWLAARKNLDFLPINYAGLIENPAAGAARVNKFLDHELNEEAMAAAIDAGLY